MFLSFYVGIESTHFYTVIYHLYLGSDSHINEEIFPHLKFHQKLQNSSNISGFLLAVSNHLTGVMFSHKPQRIAIAGPGPCPVQVHSKSVRESLRISENNKDLDQGIAL